MNRYLLFAINKKRLKALFVYRLDYAVYGQVIVVPLTAPTNFEEPVLSTHQKLEPPESGAAAMYCVSLSRQIATRLAGVVVLLPAAPVPIAALLFTTSRAAVIRLVTRGSAQTVS